MLFCGLLATGQSAGAEIDALIDSLRVTQGEQRVDLLNAIASRYIGTDLQLSAEYGTEARQLASDIGYICGEAEAVRILGEAHFAESNYTIALPYFQELRGLYAKCGDRTLPPISPRRVGDCYYHLGNYDEGLKRYFESLRELEGLLEQGCEEDMRLRIGHQYGAIGNAYRFTGEAKKALEYYHKSLDLYEQEGYTIGIAGMNCNMGNIYQERQEYDKALDHFFRAKTVAEELSDNYLLTMAMTNIGSAYLDLGNPDESLGYFMESYEICEGGNRRRGILHNLTRIGDVYYKKGDYEEANRNYVNALSIAKELDDNNMLSSLNRSLSKNYEAVHDYNSALTHYKIHSSIKDSLLNVDKIKRLSELQIAYETEKKEKEIEILKKDKAAQDAMRRLLILAFCLALVAILLLASRYRLKVRTSIEIEKKNDDLTIAREKAERLSRTDDLTKLPNRRDITERIEQEQIRCQRSGNPFVLVLIDIDDFKSFNDRFGHDCGDLVLITLARLLLSLLREQDCVGRWGGEEFLLLCPETTLHGGQILAEKIRKSIQEERINCQQIDLSVTMTLGVSEFARGMSIDECIKRADQALYEGKETGKNRVVLAG